MAEHELVKVAENVEREVEQHSLASQHGDQEGPML